MQGEKRLGVMTYWPHYKNHVCTVVDNSQEVIDGKYTKIPSELLLHLSPRVRRKVDGRIFEDFLYIGEHTSKEELKQYNFYFEYEYEELSKEQIIKDLYSVIYDVEPMLVESTLMGYSGHHIWDNPNWNSGKYVLNNNEEYLITRKKDVVKFYHNDELIHEGVIDHELFEIIYDRCECRRKICGWYDKMLETGELVTLINEYESLKEKAKKRREELGWD